jgi:hypothetical protein
MSVRMFPDWLSDQRLDPRGAVLLGMRSPRAVWWPSITEEPMPSPALEAELPRTSGCRPDPRMGPWPQLEPSPATSLPATTIGITNDLGRFSRSICTFTDGWR